ncbi:MAG: gliding motility-associated C-terminal domain-containing protein, partial [Maribacter sp.]
NGNGLDDAYDNGQGIIPVDSDGDGVNDIMDTDADNDNVPDNNEGNDFNFDGVPDQTFTGIDTDGDGLDDGYEGSNINDGFDVNDEIDNPATDLPDTDGTEDVNYRDVDDDGDGVPTKEEDPNNDGDPTNDDTDGDGVLDYLDPIDNRFRDPNFEDLTIICGDEIPAVPELGDIGGCSEAIVDFNEQIVDVDGTEDYMIERTWNVSDSCGNVLSFSQTIFVMQPQLEEITIDVCIEEEAIDLLNYLPQGFDTNGSFIVLQGDVVLVGSIFEPMAHLPGEYKIGYSSTGGTCKYYVDFTIVENVECVPCGRDEIVLSKAVTANGDGVNDYFEIKGVEYCTFSFDVMIFNRWGTKVAEVEDYQNNWGGEAPNGSFGQSGMLPTGTYYYIVTATDKETGQILKPFNGYIYLGTE